MFLIASVIDNNNSGLYPDDGLILFRNVNRQSTDRIRKHVVKIFEEAGFKSEIKTKLNIVYFLDVTFNLRNSTYQSYKIQTVIYYMSTHLPTSLLK